MDSGNDSSISTCSGDHAQLGQDGDNSLPSVLERLHHSLLEKYKTIDQYESLYESQQQKIANLQTQIDDRIDLTCTKLEIARLEHAKEEILLDSAELIKHQEMIKMDTEAMKHELMRYAEVYQSLLTQCFMDTTRLEYRRVQLSDSVNIVSEQLEMAREELCSLQLLSAATSTSTSTSTKAGAMVAMGANHIHNTLAHNDYPYESELESGLQSREHIQRLIHTTQHQRMDFERELCKCEKRHAVLCQQLKWQKQTAAQNRGGFRPQMSYQGHDLD